MKFLRLSVFEVEIVFADEGRLTLFEGGTFALVSEAGRLVCLDAVPLSVSILMAVDGVGRAVEGLFVLIDGSRLLSEVFLVDSYCTASTTGAGGICYNKD